MRTITFSLAVLSFVIIGAAACSSSDTTPAPVATGGSGGSAGASGAGGAAGGTAGTSGGGSTGAAGSATDQCTNASDEAAIQATYPVGDASAVGVPDIAAICGQGCLGTGDAVTCTTTCILKDTNNAVSKGCAGCYSASVDCAIQHCLLDCASAPSSQACVDCRCGKTGDKINCFDAYSACSGIPSTTCTDVADGGSEGGSDASVDALAE